MTRPPDAPGGYRSSRLDPAPGVAVLPPARHSSPSERVVSALLDLCALPVVALAPRRQVEVLGEGVPLEYDFRRWAWRSERSVELGLGSRALAGRRLDDVLEVGNVMHGAGVSGHTVVDRYEAGDHVVNEDIVGFDPGRRYSLVLSISTVEHIGWDEQPRDPEKAVVALEHMTRLIEPGGAMLVTVPVGYHPALDDAFVARAPFERVALLVKVSRLARWEERPLGDRARVRYGAPYANGNAVLVGVRGEPFSG